MKFEKFVNTIVKQGKEIFPVSIYTDRHEYFLDFVGEDVIYYIDNTDKVLFRKTGEFPMTEIVKAIEAFEAS